MSDELGDVVERRQQSAERDRSGPREIDPPVRLFGRDGHDSGRAIKDFRPVVMPSTQMVEPTDAELARLERALEVGGRQLDLEFPPVELAPAAEGEATTEPTTASPGNAPAPA